MNQRQPRYLGRFCAGTGGGIFYNGGGTVIVTNSVITATWPHTVEITGKTPSHSLDIELKK